MNLLNHYYYFSGVLTPRFCDELLKYGKKNQEQIALTGGVDIEKGRDLKKNPLSQKELKNLKKKRDSNITWLNDRWIYNEIQPYVKEANRRAGWNFEWDWSESCQFTKYKPGQYYGWHSDSWETPYNHPDDPNTNGKIRKLSVTCSLSDPSEYQGGELEFNFNNPEKGKKNNIKKCIEILPRGSIVVFPSFVWHRVCPVKKGTRYSLVIWNLGYPYR
jgi:PKHD-type hydroxylase